MDIYLISPPEETNYFNAEVFDKITDIIPIKFFQFRPKSKSLEERFDFVNKHFKPFSEICKKKKLISSSMMILKLQKSFVLMEFI